MRAGKRQTKPEISDESCIEAGASHICGTLGANAPIGESPILTREDCEAAIANGTLTLELSDDDIADMTDIDVIMENDK